MIRLLLMITFSVPPLFVIRAAIGDGIEVHESLFASIVAAMFSQIWIGSIEK